MKALDLPPPHLRPAGSETALGGLRVVDFSHFVAGPYCTVMLADFGADVLKIEHPDRGDDMRHARYAPGDDVGSPFIWGNRNKRSVGLDLSTQAGRDVARALVDSADILVENFSTGVMGRLGLGYEEVSQSNPRLIYCSISAAGRSGPLAHRAGFDSIAQAESGFMSVNGHPGDPPVVCGAPVMDMTTAMMACNAILAAIVARERLGKGQFVEISLFDQGVAMLGYHATTYLLTGISPVALGNNAGALPSVGVFEASDGRLFICCANDRTYERLARDVLQADDLLTPDLLTAPGRAAKTDFVRARINEIVGRKSRAEWLPKMHAASAPAAPVATIAEAMQSQEVASRGLLSEIAHPQFGAVPNVAPPYRLSLTPTVDPRAAPVLGAHTREVLAGALGYDDAKLDTLEAAGVFGKQRSKQEG